MRDAELVDARVERRRVRDAPGEFKGEVERHEAGAVAPAAVLGAVAAFEVVFASAFREEQGREGEGIRKREDPAHARLDVEPVVRVETAPDEVEGREVGVVEALGEAPFADRGVRLGEAGGMGIALEREPVLHDVRGEAPAAPRVVQAAEVPDVRPEDAVVHFVEGVAVAGGAAVGEGGDGPVPEADLAEVADILRVEARAREGHEHGTVLDDARARMVGRAEAGVHVYVERIGDAAGGTGRQGETGKENGTVHGQNKPPEREVHCTIFPAAGGPQLVAVVMGAQGARTQ